MSLVVQCRCGGRFSAPPHLAGQRVACPNCGQALVVPQVETPVTPVAPAEALVAACVCGRRYAAQPELRGQQVTCPGCGSLIVVGAMPPPADPLALAGYSQYEQAAPTMPFAPQRSPFRPTYGFVGAPTPVRQPSRRELKKRLNQLSLMFAVPGFFIIIAGAVLNGLISQSEEPTPLALLVVMVGTGLYITGLCFYAKSKGHTPFYGIVGFTGLCGLILLALLDDRMKD